MRRRRFRWDMRTITLSVAAFAIGIAVLIVWLGARYDRETDRIVAEGRLVQGRFLSQTQGSCSSRDGCDPGTLDVAYEVDGVTYRTSMLVPVRRGSGPVFEAERIRVPRLGPERPYQVVYLPSDPATSRLREDISKSDAAVYGTAGMFALVGLVFGAMGLFVLRRRN
ncbi:MAG: hypothetical protein ACXWUR_09450 [Allosphingosinicella sp.]